MLTAFPLPSNDLGTWLTLLAMRSMVVREFMLPVVRLTATNIVAGLGGKDGVAQATEIREWLNQYTEFLRDPDGAEMVHSPSWQIQQVQNNGRVYIDCDDVAVVSAALGKSIGLRARFVVVGFDAPYAPFRHVWTELSPVAPMPVWVDMDTTRPAQGLPLDRITRMSFMDV